MSEKASRLTPSAAYLAWEEMRRTMAEFAKQERQALKKHQSVRDIHRARKDYMTNILRGQKQ